MAEEKRPGKVRAVISEPVKVYRVDERKFPLAVIGEAEVISDEPGGSEPEEPEKEVGLSDEGFRRKFGISPDTKCIGCGQTAQEIADEYGEDAVQDGLSTEKGWVCFPCRESDEEHANTVVIHNAPPGHYYGGYDDEEGNIVCGVGDYFDETDGEFEFRWHSTDAWRGYYECKPSAKWRLLITDCILSYSADAAELRKLDDEIRAHLDEEGIPYARVFARTSNLFSSGYDLYVASECFGEVENFVKLAALVRELRKKYRDPERFRLTALTGKDEFDERDKLLEIYEQINIGGDFEEIKEEVLREAEKLDEKKKPKKTGAWWKDRGIAVVGAKIPKTLEEEPKRKLDEEKDCPEEEKGR